MKNILVADSGGSKTDWRLRTADGKILQAKTKGLSPFYNTSESIAQTIANELLPQINGILPDEVFFYGAGCSSDNMNAVVEAGFKAVFAKAKTEIAHDLLGAARALCGKKPGIACILGTGSNSCVFDGNQIVENRPSLGLYLGDEGSGGHLGKMLITAFLYGEMPADLAQKLKSRYHLSKENILENVYKKPEPNKYLASFSHFLLANIEERFCAELVMNSFREFFSKHVLHYDNRENLPIHFTGGIAMHFSSFLQRVCAENGLRFGIVSEKSVSGLLLYHTEQQTP